MSSRSAALVVATLLVGCVRTVSVSPNVAAARPADQSPAIALEGEVRRIVATRGTLWPGFDPLAVPLAVYDGERTFLFRHPAPPAGFRALSAATPATQVRDGRDDAITANSSAEIGGVPTATLMLDRPTPGGSILDFAPVAIHEQFHVDQRARHPAWIANEADLFTYPTDSADLLTLRRLESDALRQALAATEEASAACWSRGALALRRQRFALMEPMFAAYERGTEMNEGLATYVQLRAAGRRSVDSPPGEFGPAEVRLRAYSTGPALALLLDRFAPAWPARFEADDRQSLDGALTVAVGAGEVCTAGAAATTAAMRKAQADIATLVEVRARKLATFERRAGRRIVVESGGGEPMWPQGFDPLNVDRLGTERVLHTRFLRLGNGAGKLAVLDAAALTEGVGPHPLFQGVRRVVLTGMDEPVVTEADGTVRLRAPGVTLQFKGAKVARVGDVITVRLSP